MISSSVETRKKAVDLLIKGQYAEAVPLLETCCEPAPEDIRDLWYLGIALLLNGDEELAQFTWLSAVSQAENAEELVQHLVNTIDQFAANLLRHQQVGAAQTLYSTIYEIDADFADAYLGMALSYYQSQQFQQAIPYFQQFLAHDSSHQQAYYQLADCLTRVGHLDEAIALMEQAVEVNSHFGEAYLRHSDLLCQKLDSVNLENQGDIQAKLHRFAEKARSEREYAIAEYCFQNLVKFFPDDAEAIYKLAVAKCAASRTDADEIINLYKQAIQLEPRAIRYYCKFAVYLNMLNRISEAFSILQEAATIDPNDLSYLYTLGTVQRSSRQFDEALVTFQTVLQRYANQDVQNLDPSILLTLSCSHTEIGHIYDKRQLSQEAFRHFSVAKQLSYRCMSQRVLERKQQSLDEVYRFTDLLKQKKISAGDYACNQKLQDSSKPAFLTGFPRSGTTLLGRILDSHSQAKVLVEKPAILHANEMIGTVVTEKVLKNPQTLRQISPEAINATRDQYLDFVNTYIDYSPKELLVDENPFYSIGAWQLHKIYPEAPFIFVLRHPCDVVLSCFMQSFELNCYTSHFLSLEETVNFYVNAMKLWQLQCSLLDLKVHTVVYERLVEDFEAEVRPLLNYLDLPWEESVKEFHRNKNQAQVRTASYQQVTQPLYKQAKYRWQSYRQYLEPYLGQLMPFIQQWGYQV